MTLQSVSARRFKHQPKTLAFITVSDEHYRHVDCSLFMYKERKLNIKCISWHQPLKSLLWEIHVIWNRKGIQAGEKHRCTTSLSTLKRRGHVFIFHLSMSPWTKQNPVQKHILHRNDHCVIQYITGPISNLITD